MKTKEAKESKQSGLRGEAEQMEGAATARSRDRKSFGTTANESVKRGRLVESNDRTLYV